MAKITSLKIQARNKNRVNVYLDGKFAFGLVKIEAIRLRLGQELSEADLATLKNADEAEMAYEKTLNFLSYRQRSEDEIRRYLKKKELPEAQAEGIVERLKRAGLLNDTTFAEMWVDSRTTFKPKAKRVLKAELRMKGVSAAEIEKAVANVDEAQAAQQLAAARAPRLVRAKLNKLEFRKKLSDYLARRGFNYETISDAVERAWREHGGDEGGDDAADHSIESEI
jgi:regulatory protein